MRWMWIALLFLVVFSGTSFFESYADSKPEDHSRRMITVYSSLSEQYTALVARNFEKRTGVEVHYVVLPDHLIPDRLLQEKDDPRADIWLGGYTENLYVARRDVLLDPYQSSSTQMVADQFKDEDGYWTGVFVDVTAFVTSQDAPGGRERRIPLSWDDLIRPDHKRVVMVDPATSPVAATPLMTILAMKGEKDGFQYLSMLHQKVLQYPKQAYSPGRMTLMGEADVGVMPMSEALRYIHEGFPLNVSFPREGTGYQTLSVAVVKGSPHPQEVASFVDYLMTEDAQQLAYASSLYYYGTNPSARIIIPETKQPLDQIPLIMYDRKWESLKRNLMVEKWMQQVRWSK